MKTIQKIIAVVTMVTVVATLRYCARATKETASPLVVGTSADFAPFSFIDAQGNIAGFDIDLLSELFRRLNMPYRLENMPFETLLTQMQFGGIDLIAAGMSPTAERATRLLFSIPYIQADPMMLVTLKDSALNSLHSLHGKRVAVNQGYVADLQLSKIPEITLMRLPSLSDALLALKHGKVDAFVTGGGTLKPLQAALGADTLRAVPVAELQEDTALGISKRLPDLKEKIDAALQEMEADGSLQRLKMQWDL